MKITVIGVGRLKEKYWRDACAEYLKRLGRYIKMEVLEVSDEKAPENLSAAQEGQVKEKEGERILKYLREDSFVIALVIDGKSISSEEFSSLLRHHMDTGTGNIVFVIGGSLGLSPQILSRANYKLSFSSMTFPHQLMRVILLEQIYRGFKILKKEPYHK